MKKFLFSDSYNQVSLILYLNKSNSLQTIVITRNPSSNQRNQQTIPPRPAEGINHTHTIIAFTRNARHNFLPPPAFLPISSTFPESTFHSDNIKPSGPPNNNKKNLTISPPRFFLPAFFCSPEGTYTVQV